ncbi:MAG: acyltransferase, partial [Acetobacteraceae bacterium]|nr:acyltransferase [Acetobacteraceae bacterium]
LPYEQKLIFPAWSLDIELQYYLVAPIVMFWVRETRNFSFGRLALVAIGAVGLIFLGTYYMRSAQSGTLPLYLGFFLIGLHTAHLSWRPGRVLAVGSLGVALAIVLVCCLIPQTRSLFLEGSFSGAFSDYNSLADAVVALIATPYVMSTVYQAPSKNRAIGRIDRDLSNVTYEIYLFHWSAATIIGHFIGTWSKYQQLPIIVLAWIAIFPFSWLVYRVLDRPCDRPRVAYVRSRMRPASHRGGQKEIAGVP